MTLIESTRGKFGLCAVGTLAATLLIGATTRSDALTDVDGEVLEEMVEHRDGPLTSIMEAVTAVFSPAGTLALSLLVAVIIGWRRRSVASGAFVLISVALASAMTLVLKQLFARERPPVIDHLVAESDFGFPSGHVTGTTALALAVAFVVATGTRGRARYLVGAVALAIIGVVAASRLYLGVHWFTDTVAGVLIGLGGVLGAAAAFPPTSWDMWSSRVAAIVPSRSR